MYYSSTTPKNIDMFSHGRVFTSIFPMRSHGEGTHAEELHRRVLETLGSGDLEVAVRRPEGEDENEWLAMHTVDFYNEISLLFALIEDRVTDERYPTFTAGPKFEYLWRDGVAYPRPTSVSARRYVELLMKWVDSLLGDERIFPTKSGAPFPSDFRDRVGVIFRRFFRVFAHIYHNHLEAMEELGATAHLNTVFKHFVLFTKEYELLPEREYAPVQTLIRALLEK